MCLLPPLVLQVPHKLLLHRSQVTPTRSKSRSIPWSLRHFGDQRCVLRPHWLLQSADVVVAPLMVWGCYGCNLGFQGVGCEILRGCLWFCVLVLDVVGSVVVFVKVYLSACKFASFSWIALGFGISLSSEVICAVEVHCLSWASVVVFVWGSMFWHVFFWMSIVFPYSWGCSTTSLVLESQAMSITISNETLVFVHLCH